MDSEKVKACFENVKKSLDRQKKSLEEEYKKMLDLVDDEVWQRRSEFVIVLHRKMLDMLD